MRPGSPETEANSSAKDTIYTEAANKAFDDLGMAEGMSLLAKIYSSGDTILIRAINANLMAFGETVDNKKAINDIAAENTEMRVRVDSLEQKLTALEKRMSEEDGSGQAAVGE